VKRRLFSVAVPGLNACLSQICEQTVGIDVTEIEAVDIGTLGLLNPEISPDVDNSEFFGQSLKHSQSADVASVVAVIIDATSESAAIVNWLQDFPETACWAGLKAFEQFGNSPGIPKSLDPGLPDCKALRLLALAIMLSRSGFLCLLCVHNRQTRSLEDVLTRAANTKSLGFRFVIEPDPVLAFQEAVRSVNALQCVGGRAFSTPSSSRTGRLKLEPLKHYVEQWEAEEFEEDKVIDALRMKVAKAASAQDKTPSPSDEREIQREILLRSATLARLLATRSFEHHGCNAIIVLADRETIDQLAGPQTQLLGNEVFNFQGQSRPTWFHLGDPWLQEDGIETALSSRSVLLVDLYSGQVLGVRELNCQSETRFEILNHLTTATNRRSIFALAALESGYVEIHHDGSLAFWYDRYRWRHDPFGQMQRRIREARLLPSDCEEESLSKICAAISILMDTQESSILVFAHADAQPKLNGLIESMRPSLGLCSESGGIQHPNESSLRARFGHRPLLEFSASTLASVFRLDGAHVISGGQITHAAQRIVIRQDQTNSDSDSNNHGTGRKAAQFLADSIPGSVVVKVSSSGELKVYTARQAQMMPLSIQ
jgi:hypothetical protein